MQNVLGTRTEPKNNRDQIPKSIEGLFSPFLSLHYQMESLPPELVSLISNNLSEHEDLKALWSSCRHLRFDMPHVFVPLFDFDTQALRVGYLAKWLTAVHNYWPECDAELSEDITKLSLDKDYLWAIYSFPPNLLDLHLSPSFAYPCLPDTLVTLSISDNFDRTLVVPSGLKHLYLGESFTNRLILPEGLETLSFSAKSKWDRPLTPPLPTLKTAIFGPEFNQPLGHLPASLEYLEVGRHFKSALVIPRSLKTLVLDFALSSSARNVAFLSDKTATFIYKEPYMTLSEEAKALYAFIMHIRVLDLDRPIFQSNKRRLPLDL